jgi:L-amino acid N-acyltransferase YncA
MAKRRKIAMTVTLKIRLASVDDSVAIAEIYTPYVRDTAVSFEYDPPTAAMFGERITAILQKYPWLVCEVEGRIAGYAYASKYSERAAYDWSVDSAVYVHPDFQRRGIASALYHALFGLLRLQGFYNVYAGVTGSNAPSAGFHRCLGFRPVGTYHSVGFKFDRWHDVTWWQLQLAEYPPVPARPKTIGAVGATPEFPAIIAQAVTGIKL